MPRTRRRSTIPSSPRWARSAPIPFIEPGGARGDLISEHVNGREGPEVFKRCPPPDAARDRHSGEHRRRDPRAQGPQRRAREGLRRAARDEGRGDRRKRHDPARQVRQHGRSDGARGGLACLLSGRRRHHDGDGPRPRHRPRRRQAGGGGRQPDGSETRDRRRRRGGGRRAADAIEGDRLERGDRADRHDLRQRGTRDRPLSGRGDGSGGQGWFDHRRGRRVVFDRGRGRRGDAVRSRLYLADLRDGSQADARRARRAPCSSSSIASSRR